MNNVIPLHTDESVRLGLCKVLERGVRRLEFIRWHELTREQKLENLQALAQALLFERLLNTKRFDISSLAEVARETETESETGTFNFDIDLYVDCIKGGREP